MESIVNYIIESTSILGLFLIIYKLALNKYESLNFNRAYLLIAVAISTVVPLFEFSVNVLPEADIYQGNLDSASAFQIMVEYPGEAKRSILSYILDIEAITWIYLIGVIILIFRLIKASIQIKHLITQYQVISIDRENNLIYLPKEFRSFSFFKYIFISRDRYSDSQIEHVITHERAHIELWHSIDNIIIELLLIFEWFNPFVWYLRREIKEIHEFQADRRTLRSVQSVGQYKALLLFETTGIYPNVASTMANSLTKKRFTMMSKRENRRFLGIKQISALTAAIAVSTLFCIKVNAVDNSIIDTVKESTLNLESQEVEPINKSVSDTLNSKDLVFMSVEERASFPGGMKALAKHLSEETKFPAEIPKDEKVNVMVHVKFIISDNGTIRDATILNIKDMNPEIDANKYSGIQELGTEANRGDAIKNSQAFKDEALRVVNNMPNWTPGKQRGEAVNCYFVLPIKFSKNNDTKARVYTTDNSDVFMKVEEPASFPGGMTALLTYLGEEVIFPTEIPQDEETHIKVAVRFIVTDNGKVKDATILRTTDLETESNKEKASKKGKACEDEALRVVNKMPNWTPGKQDGKAVNSYFVVPINFYNK